jgi:RNA polymerase sigma-70 factor, ECF subfamily
LRNRAGLKYFPSVFAALGLMSNGKGCPAGSGQVAAEFEHELLLARDGQLQRLGPLLERYRPFLLAIAGQEVGPELAGKVGASDLVQDTLVRGVEHFGSFEGATPEQLAGWLRQILVNHARNVAKAYGTEKRDVAREEPIDSRLAFHTGTSPSRELLAQERAEQFQSALSRLPEELRQVIELRHRENLSFAEIGFRLATSEDTVRRTWARAVAWLQSELAHQESSGE